MKRRRDSRRESIRLGAAAIKKTEASGRRRGPTGPRMLQETDHRARRVMEAVHRNPS